MMLISLTMPGFTLSSASWSSFAEVTPPITKKLTITITLLILATLTFAQTTGRGLILETITEPETALGQPEIKFQTGHSDSVFSVNFSPDGKYIASGSRDDTVKLWDVDSGKEIRTFSGHTSYVTSVSFSPDGKYIASGRSDDTIKLWEAESGKEIRTLIGHTNDVESVSFSPDSKYLVSGGGADGTVKLWNVETGELIYTFINGKDGEWLTYTPEGFFTGSEWATKNLVHIVDGLEVIGIDQVYDKLYRPVLVAAKMRGEDISMYSKEVRNTDNFKKGGIIGAILLQKQKI